MFQQATRYQPISEGTITNSMSYRGMEGFWAAVTPFNFTAIGGNLPSAPAIAVSYVVKFSIHDNFWYGVVAGVV